MATFEQDLANAKARLILLETAYDNIVTNEVSTMKKGSRSTAEASFLKVLDLGKEIERLNNRIANMELSI